MKKFKFLDISTADVGFLAYGKDLNEVFSNSALAMFETMIDTKGVKQKVKKTIEIDSHDLKSLLFDWLNELIFHYGAENLAFSKFDIKIDDENFKLKATCQGEKINLQKHEVRTEVKAATYHKMEIKETKQGWEAQVIVDT
jgi:SHS2 domain-containing protein